jgi:HAD superfamily hydrolase (TIGR01509 family)
MIRAVVFDMDGVLIDAREWHYDALNRALGLFGYAISRLEHLTTFDGLSTRQKLDLLSLDRGLPRGLHTFINEMKQRYTVEVIHQRCRPSFIHEYALSKLREKGYQLGVASNSIRATVELMMEKSHLRQHLQIMLSNQDVAKAKPDPEIYRAAAARLHLKPEECLVVEDNAHGIKAAEAAGCPVLAVTGVNDVNLHNILATIQRLDDLQQ